MSDNFNLSGGSRGGGPGAYVPNDIRPYDQPIGVYAPRNDPNDLA